MAETRFRLKEVTLSDASGTIPLTIIFADGSRFVPEDDARLRKWVAEHRRLGWLRSFERHQHSVFAVLLATLLLMVLYIGVLKPLTIRYLALLIPDYVEQQIGRQTLHLLRQNGFQDSQLPAAQQQRVSRLFSVVLAATSPRGAVPVRLTLMQCPGAPGAFMLADGNLILCDQLIKLAPGDDALAAMMLHEIAHHHWHHPMRLLVRSSLFSLCYMWLIGDISGIDDKLLKQASFLHQMHFTRAMERDADQWTMMQMQAQGRSLEAMANIYELIRQQGGPRSRGLALPHWLSSDSDMPLRIEAIREAEGH
ncbi:M48 family metallopeptidase [Pantoea sp. B65]|uniref:M48 family metallopeptidase n=1 Tax=Pantoea sp. B65 TaxID=2813359 RepID=UPI0039B6C1C2